MGKPLSLNSLLPISKAGGETGRPLAPNVCNFVILQAHGEGSDGMTCKVSTVSDKVLEITISNSERHAKTSSGEADSRGEEREMGEGNAN